MSKPYTKYYLELMESPDSPQLTGKKAIKIGKILYLEGRVHGLRFANKGMQGTTDPYRFSVAYSNIGKKLTELTGNRDPKDVFDDILKN